MPTQLAVVTGADRGLGLEVVRQLAARGWRVLLAVRREAEGRAAAASLLSSHPEGRAPDARVWPLDVADPESVASFGERARSEGLRVSALVQNAGVYSHRADEPGARETMAANVLGPLRLADALSPLLLPSARVVMVSSGMGQLSGLPADLRAAIEAIRTREDVAALADEIVRRAAAGAGGGGSLLYSVSKAALNAVTRLLARELAPRQVLVNAVCPGWVRTDMGGAGAPRSVEEGARGIVWAAGLPPDAPTGGFFRDGKPLPW
jgi:NAD(P)-dependent dehydrogenase (short-subunit alcohol dehydrogenase family)